MTSSAHFDIPPSYTPIKWLDITWTTLLEEQYQITKTNGDDEAVRAIRLSFLDQGRWKAINIFV